MDFYCKVDEQGVAHPYKREEMKMWIGSFARKEICMRITPVKIKKTQRQNNGLYLLLTLFTQYLNESTGNDLDLEDVKRIVKLERKFFKDSFDKNTGKFIGQKFRSFSELGLTETSEWIEWLYAWSVREWKIVLPPLEQK